MPGRAAAAIKVVARPWVGCSRTEWYARTECYTRTHISVTIHRIGKSLSIFSLELPPLQLWSVKFFVSVKEMHFCLIFYWFSLPHSSLPLLRQKCISFTDTKNFKETKVVEEEIVNKKSSWLFPLRWILTEIWVRTYHSMQLQGHYSIYYSFFKLIWNTTSTIF